MKLHIVELAITGETGQCKEDKLVVSDAYSTLGDVMDKVQLNLSISIHFTYKTSESMCQMLAYNVCLFFGGGGGFTL